MSTVRASTAGCALFPERILRCRLVIRLYYKAFAETRSCLPVRYTSDEGATEHHVPTARRNHTDTRIRSLDRPGLGRSDTLLEHAHHRRPAATRPTGQHPRGDRDLGGRVGPA